jgi:ABC-2 type transport system permease protein
MSTAVYTRYEVLRAFRNTRYFIISFAFPLLLFLLIAGPNRHEQLDDIPFATYYMAGMISWGAMGAVIAAGARIAAERAVGWHRQVRVTPLPVRTYFEAKVLTGYLMAGVTILLLALAGLALGVHLSMADWVTMTVLVLIGLIPFAVLGILVGHLVTVDSMGPAIGGLTALFALLGGAWGPIVSGGVLLRLAEGLPSYWLVQAGKAAVGGDGWPATAWIVIAVWTLALSALAVVVYQRDTARVGP